MGFATGSTEAMRAGAPMGGKSMKTRRVLKPKWYVRRTSIAGREANTVWLFKTSPPQVIEQEMDYDQFQSMFGVTLESGKTYTLTVKAKVKEEGK